MREYPVPFSAREEAPFMSGLTIREMLWIAGGFLIGFIFAIIVFSLFKVKIISVIVCLPVIIPFMLMSLYLAKKQIKEDDKKETLDRHYYKLFKYKYRPKKYLNYREGGS